MGSAPAAWVGLGAARRGLHGGVAQQARSADCIRDLAHGVRAAAGSVTPQPHLIDASVAARSQLLVYAQLSGAVRNTRPCFVVLARQERQNAGPCGPPRCEA